MSVSAKTKAYVEAILKNPEFIKTVALDYGSGLTLRGDGTYIASVTMVQLSSAIDDLETRLAEHEARHHK